MFFVLSKIFVFLTHPFSWILIALIIAWVTKRPRLSRYCFRGAIIALLFFTNSVIFLEFTRLWEPEGKKIEDVGHYDCAVVLGGMAEYDSNHERLSIRRGGDRIWQAVHLYHLGKVDKILISGNNGSLLGDELQEAKQFREVLIDMGIPDEDILTETKSRNTHENAKECKVILENEGIESMLLVTSALHMPRAKGCFEGVGIKDFDTFTTDHYTGASRGYKFDQFLAPNVSTMADWERLIHEWIGTLSYRIMGYI
jgi:uncharacterized SAM-binding protein YcdF (DUF218 family)